MTMILPVVILCATTVFAQIEAVSLTVDRSDAAVAGWLDSLEARERAARGHLSDSTAVGYLQSVLDGTVDAPDSVVVLDFSLIGGVEVLPDSIGGEHWARVRFSSTKTGVTRKLITGAVGVAVRERGAIALSATEVRIAAAPGKQFLEDLAAHLAQ